MYMYVFDHEIYLQSSYYELISWIPHCLQANISELY